MDRPAVPPDPVLRESEDGGGLEPLGGGRQPQAGPTAHEADGTGGSAPQAEDDGGGTGAKAYPYLLRDRKLTRIDEVWSSDITYVPMKHGFMYLTAVIDWYSRYVLSWRLSNTLDGGFCLEALEEALSHGKPEIFNTDLGSQFTSREYTGRLEEAGIAVSRDGRGRALDNIFIERLWRSVKYEDIYIKDYEFVPELVVGLTAYFRFYDEDRPHQSLDYQTPGEVYRAGVRAGWAGEDHNKYRPPDCPVFGVHYTVQYPHSPGCRPYLSRAKRLGIPARLVEIGAECQNMFPLRLGLFVLRRRSLAKPPADCYTRQPSGWLNPGRDNGSIAGRGRHSFPSLPSVRFPHSSVQAATTR